MLLNMTHSQTVPFEPLITMREACEALNVSRPTLYVLMQRHGLGWVQIGGRRMFQPETLRTYLDERRSEVAA